jgi:nucleoside-diphosphate-sugar epimerase
VLDAVIVTGANGLLGASISKMLAERLPSAVRILALLRSDAASSELLREIGPEVGRRVEIVRANLCDPESMRTALPEAELEHAIMIHCAADVSWDKTEAELAPINVGGSLAAARLLCTAAGKPGLIFVSSAYTSTGDWTYRNGYEASKAAAETALRAEFSELPLSVFSCSLVVGDQSTGAISRFHGLYPLVRLMAATAPPFVIGRPDCAIDLVPIDWVTEQLYSAFERTLAGERVDIVAASGSGAIRLDAMVRGIEAQINAFRQECGFEPFDEVPIISYRRWEFLQRTVAAWRPTELSNRDFRQIAHLIRIYQPYTVSDVVRGPKEVDPAPAAVSLVGPSTRYWLERNAHRLRRRWREMRVTANKVT